MANENVPDSARIMAAIDATWAPAEMARHGGWVLRRGAGGGKRVSAASGHGDIDAAEAAMRGWGQDPMFRLIPSDGALDSDLSARGYALVDPVTLYAARAETLTGEQSHIAAAYRCAFRPAVMEEIWEAGGIGPARLAIMDRVPAPKLFLMSRADDTPAGAAFAAVDGDVAMIHAIEVFAHLRRQGAARLLVELAARFALEQGAGWLALAVTKANIPANALYGALGMAAVGAYHYRVHADGDPT